MDFEARVITFLGETTGTSKAGNPWKKKEWIVETPGQYAKKVKLQCFGDRSDLINLVENRDYVLSVDLESREYNGRWYTDVNVFRAQEITGPREPAQPGNQVSSQSSANQPYVVPGDSFNSRSQTFIAEESDSDEDLPF